MTAQNVPGVDMIVFAVNSLVLFQTIIKTYFTTSFVRARNHFREKAKSLLNKQSLFWLVTGRE